jgi:hypothetical protein
LGRPAGDSAAVHPPELVIRVKSGDRAYGPQMLPGGQAVLFTLSTATNGLDAWDSGRSSCNR